jgi:ferric-dicitrate binding protein FerR (iron transport regulator)
VNRYGGPQARVVGATDVRVSGAFRAGDPARFAHALAEVYPLSVRARPDGGADIAPR